MNEGSTNLQKFIKLMTLTLLTLGIFAMLGGYVYYQRNIVDKAGYTEISIDIDTMSDSELIDQILKSVPKTDPEDALTEEEVAQILKNNQTKIAEDDSITDSEYSLIIKNNLQTEGVEI